MTLDTLRTNAELLVLFNSLKLSIIDNNSKRETNGKISVCFSSLIFELSKYGINDVFINEAFDYFRNRYHTLKQKLNYCVSLKSILEEKYEMYNKQIRSVVIVGMCKIIYLLNAMNELNNKLLTNQWTFIEKLCTLDMYSMYNFLSCRFTCVSTGNFLNDVVNLDECTIVKVLRPKELNVMRYEFVIKNNTEHSKIIVGFSLNSLTGDISRFFV